MKTKLFALLFACVLAAAPLTVSKTPAESFNLGVNFAAVVGSHNITLVGVTAVNAATGANVASTIIAGSPAPQATTSATVNGTVTTGKFIIFRVQGGVAGQRYLIGAKAQDATTGEIYEGQIVLQVAR